MVCCPGVRFKVCGAVCGAPPSTVNCKPVGTVWMVMPVSGEKLATTVSAALMVTVVEALEALATGPVQLLKTNPAVGVAAMFTAFPEV